MMSVWKLKLLSQWSWTNLWYFSSWHYHLNKTNSKPSMPLICSPPGEWTSRIVHLLNDQHMGVVTAAASLIDALVKKNPEEYKGCISLAVSRLSRVGTRQHIVHTIIGIVKESRYRSTVSIFFNFYAFSTFNLLCNIPMKRDKCT